MRELRPYESRKSAAHAPALLNLASMSCDTANCSTGKYFRARIYATGGCLNPLVIFCQGVRGGHINMTAHCVIGEMFHLEQDDNSSQASLNAELLPVPFILQEQESFW